MNYIIQFVFLITPIISFAEQLIIFNDDEMTNIGIELAHVSLVQQEKTHKLPAKVTIPNQSQRVVSAAQDGVVERLLVAEGDNVTVGQTLAQLNSPQLLSSQGEYLQALSRLRQSNRDMSRDKSLYDEGIIAERRYRQSLSRYQQDQTQVATYKKSLELAGMALSDIAALEKTGALNSHLSVLAKQNGVVMKQYTTAGQRVAAADPIYKIAELSLLWLEIHVPLDMAKQLKVNDGIQLCGKDINGHIIAIGRQVHAADQGVLIRGELASNTEQLTPGEFVQVCFVKQSTAVRFELPRSAIFRHDQQSAVFVKKQGGFISEPVEVVAEHGDTLIVTGNLSTQQQIVIKGTATVKAASLGMGGE